MRRTFAFAVVLAVLMPASAQAVCVLGTLSATPLSFGTYSPGAATAKQNQSSITIGCVLSLLQQATISLSSSTGSYAPRQMKMGTNTLGYNLYLDSADTVVWGDGTNGTSTQNFTSVVGLGSVSFPVYGAIPPGQYSAPGAYTDTVTVTVTY